MVREGAGDLTADPGDPGHRRRGKSWGKRKGGRGEALGTLGSRRDGWRWAVHGEQGRGGGGARRRGCSGGDWAMRSGREDARR